MKKLKYWYYRNAPWVTKIKLIMSDCYSFKLGDVVTFNTWIASSNYRWVYAGNNIFVLLKIKV